MRKIFLFSILAAVIGTQTALASAADNADDPAYADGWNDNTNPPADNGGTGYLPWINLENAPGSNGSKYISSAFADGRQIDGVASFGIIAGTEAGPHLGLAEGRQLGMPVTAGLYSVTARFDLDNATFFSGFNLKSTAGSQFGADGLEFLAFGMTPFTGNNAIGIFGATNLSIDFGHDIRGNIIKFLLGFDTSGAGSFTLTATDLTNPASGSVSGELKFGGEPVEVLGFANFNTGSDQSLIFDDISLEPVPEPSTWVLITSGLMLGLLKWNSSNLGRRAEA